MNRPFPPLRMLPYRKPTEGRDYWLFDEVLPNAAEVRARCMAKEDWALGFPHTQETWPGRRAIPALEETRGAIVNISSDAGVIGNAGAAIYCASKGGVTTMTKALARELAPKGIRVNALCPSDIASPMLTHQAETYGNGDPKAYYAQLLAHYPQGAASRFLTPDEVAQNVAFLLSPAAAGITGAAMMLDFGLTAGY